MGQDRAFARIHAPTGKGAAIQPRSTLLRLHLLLFVTVQMQMTNRLRKSLVLVLMPFAKSFDDIYPAGIKLAPEAAEALCQRTDEQVVTRMKDRDGMPT